MAQLTDHDILSPPVGVLSVDDVPALVESRIAIAAGTETVSLGTADGRILAVDLPAPFDLPRFDNAAVDGKPG